MAKNLLKERSAKQMEETSFMGFFPNPQQDVKSSLIFVKKIAALAISNILYVRNRFSDKDFADRKVGDLAVKVIKGNRSNSTAAQTISKWLEGAFDAIERKYLRVLIFEILEEGTCKVAEMYQLKFRYNDGIYSVEDQIGGKTVFTDSTKDTEDAVKQLIRNIFLISSLHPQLPRQCSYSMKLQYFDEVPKEYEPPGFQPCLEPLADMSGSHSYRLASVATPFHFVGISSKSRQPSSDESSVPETGMSDAYSENQLVPSTSQGTNEGTTSEKVVKCECGKADFESEDSMLRCKQCNTYQHFACFKLAIVATEKEKLEESRATHLCARCSGNSSCQLGMTKDACLFRRAVLFCTTCPSLSLRQLIQHFKMDLPSAANLMRNLQREGILRSGAIPITTEKPECLYSINKLKLKASCISKLFGGQKLQAENVEKTSANK